MGYFVVRLAPNQFNPCPFPDAPIRGLFFHDNSNLIGSGDKNKTTWTYSQEALKKDDLQVLQEEPLAVRSALQLLDLIGGELEVEEVEVLLDPLGVDRLGDDGNSTVQDVAEKNLSRALVVLLGQGQDVLVLKGAGGRGPVELTKEWNV